MVPTSSGEAHKVKVRVRLNIHGILTVASASMVEELPAIEEPKSTDDKQNADSVEPMDTTQGDGADAPSKENGVNKSADGSEETAPKDEPMNTDKDESAAEKENKV